MGEVFGKAVANPWEELRGEVVGEGAGEGAEVGRERSGSEDADLGPGPAGGERVRAVAEEFGDRDGSGVAQVVRRLESAARREKKIGEAIQKIQENLSKVRGVLPKRLFVVVM